jgi:hypothetical protein
LNQQYQVVNGQASNWTTSQDTYHPNTALGHSQQSGEAIETDDEKIAALFANGEVGCVFDLDDTAALFQDSNGVTPVTDFGQTVGLQLDKSRGGLGNLGTQLVTNGDFSNGTTGWTPVGLTIQVVSGELEITRNGSSQYVYQTIATSAGRAYFVSLSHRNGTATSGVYVGSSVGGSQLFPNTTLNSATTTTRTFVFLQPELQVRFRSD